jgi:predicted NAD/FAD-binding protein
LYRYAAGTPDLFVTLNPPKPPAADTVQHRVTLAHPLFNQAAVDAQKNIKVRLCKLNPVAPWPESTRISTQPFNP